LVTSYGQYKCLRLDALFNLEGTSGESPVTMRYLLLRKEGLRKLDRKEKANKECEVHLDKK